MNFADAREGMYVRFNHHDGSRAGGPEAPIFRLRPALSFVHDKDGVCTGSEESGWERIVVKGYPPYRVGHVLPFTPENADQFTETEIPLRKVKPADVRQDRSGTRRKPATRTRRSHS